MSSSSGGGLPADGNSLRTLFTGIVFGLQPDALFVIVPALALPSKLAAMAYIFMFVFGTVAAMGSYTAFIGAHKPLAIRLGWHWFIEWLVCCLPAVSYNCSDRACLLCLAKSKDFEVVTGPSLLHTGATSNAMQKNYSGLCSKLSSIASVVAICIGSAVLAAGFGVRLPFT